MASEIPVLPLVGSSRVSPGRSSPSASAFRRLAARAQGWTVPQGARGNLEFFVERLVGGGGNSAVGAVA